MLPSPRRGGPGYGPLPVAHASLLMEGVKSAGEETGVVIRGGLYGYLSSLGRRGTSGLWEPEAATAMVPRRGLECRHQ